MYDVAWKSGRVATWLGIVIGLALFLVSSTASARTPTAFIKAHTSEVTKLLEEEESDARAKKFSEKAEAIIDFRMLASRALEGYWEKRTEEEQDEFLELLQELLEANYKGKLEGNKIGEDYTIDYLDEKQRGDRALVRTEVKWGETEKKQKPIEYKMTKKSGGWVVYDVVIDDISLEETYRESYTKIIKEDGWESLIQKMKDKIEELEEESDEG